MKKIAKLSLVAAMAVTAANAGSLEEAIKNVDVSGKVYVEHLVDTTKNAAEESKSLTDIDVDLTFKSKVNDNVTAVVRVQADKEDAENTSHTTTKDFDAQDVTVDNVYFTYQNGGLTVMTGKQDINTPNTDGEIGNGVLALYNAGFATFAAGHFAAAEILDNGDITAAAALASLGPVNAELWYVRGSLNSDVADGTDHYTLVASTKLAGVSLGARHAITKFDGATKDRASTKVTASAAFGPIGVNATYFTTDKDGAAYVTDASSANTYELSQLGIKNVADVSLWALGASYTMDAMKYQVDYASASQEIANTQDTDMDELRLRATYTMSKNFKVMATYSMYEEDAAGTANDLEKDSARLEAKYSF